MVDDLFKTREPMPNMDVIYFISPTKESIEALMKEEEGQYKNVYLIFSATLNEETLTKIKNSRISASKKIKSIQEINFEFYAYEDKIFHMDEPNSAKFFFSNNFNNNLKDEILNEISSKLSGVFINLGQIPSVRFQKSSPFVRDLSDRFSRSLDLYSSLNPSFPQNSSNIQLLILDRSFDLVFLFILFLFYFILFIFIFIFYFILFYFILFYFSIYFCSLLYFTFVHILYYFIFYFILF